MGGRQQLTRSEGYEEVSHPEKRRLHKVCIFGRNLWLNLNVPYYRPLIRHVYNFRSAVSNARFFKARELKQYIFELSSQLVRAFTESNSIRHVAECLTPVVETRPIMRTNIFVRNLFSHFQ